MKALTDKQKERLVLAAGVLLRLVYVLFSTIHERQYDISRWDLSAPYAGGGGHLGYIHYIYSLGHLPDMDPSSVYQFSHPPLHYMLSAGWLKLMSLFIKDPVLLEESLQWLSLLCGIATLYVISGIVRLSALAGRGKLFALLLFAFHPSLILLSGSVNNDGPAFLFTLLCVYFLMRWARAQRMSDVVWLALSLGLGMMTKLSVAEMALPALCVFLYVMIRGMRSGKTGGTAAADAQGTSRAAGEQTADADSKAGRDGHHAAGSDVPLTAGKDAADAARGGAPWKLYLMQAAVFLAISMPLGLWFYLRNALVYGMPFTFVHDLGTDSWQYIGNVPAINRYLFPVPAELFENLRHLRIGCGYHVGVQIMRTSVLGEWDMAGVGAPVKALAMLLMLSGMLLALAALVAFVRVYVFRLPSGDAHRPGDGGSAPTGALRPGDGGLHERRQASPDGTDEGGVRADRAPSRGSQCLPPGGKVSPEGTDEGFFHADRILFVSAYLVHILLYLKFSYDNPYMCSMDFRYIRILLLFPAIALGFALNRAGTARCSRLLWALLILFCILAVAMTLVWCFPAFASA